MRSRVFGGTKCLGFVIIPTDLLIFTAMCSTDMIFPAYRLQSINTPRYFTYSLHSRLTSLPGSLSYITIFFDKVGKYHRFFYVKDKRVPSKPAIYLTKFTVYNNFKRFCFYQHRGYLYHKQKGRNWICPRSTVCRLRIIKIGEVEG